MLEAPEKPRPYSYTHTSYKFRKRPKRHQMTWAEERKFGPMCCHWLESIGATRGKYYDFEVFTIYGPLAITPYDHWIACRFEGEGELPECYGGPKFPGGISSRKWNHHYFDVSSSRISASELLDYFKSVLTPILAGGVK